MNKSLEYILAQKIIDIVDTEYNDDHVMYDINNANQFIECGSSTGAELIKDIMNQGLSPMTIVAYKNTTDFLIHHVFQRSPDLALVDYFITLLDKNSINKLTTKKAKELYLYLEDEPKERTKLLEKLFQLGFNFTQGTFDEEERALNGDIEFFELCLSYKKDFKFSHKYKDSESNKMLTLDEILHLDLESNESFNPNVDIRKKESLMLFLKKYKEIEILKESLDGQLSSENPTVPKKKI